MLGLYLDTSALGRVLLGEPNAENVIDAWDRYAQRVSSRLLRIELRRLASRRGSLQDADRLLADVALVPLEEDLLQAAESIEPGNVATLDAIHLATAVRLFEAGAVETVMTYDRVLAEGARSHGLDVIAPA